MADTGVDSFKLEWIISFLSVVDHGGFAAAAESTFRSQSRVSTHVADLEKQLGARLFDRTARPVRLTEAGLAFLSHARGLLRELQSARASVQQVLGVLRGRVRLGTYPSAGAAFVPGLLSTFQERFPHVVTTLHERATAELVDALVTGEADLAIRPLEPLPRDTALQHSVLWEEPLVAVVAESSPLATAQYLSLHEAAEHPIIAIGPVGSEPDGHDEVSHALAASGAHATIAFRTNEPQTLVSFVRAGLGVGLTNFLAASVSETSGTVIVPILESGNRRRVGVFWNTNRPLQPAARALLELVTQLPVPAALARYQRRA